MDPLNNPSPHPPGGAGRRGAQIRMQEPLSEALADAKRKDRFSKEVTRITRAPLLFLDDEKDQGKPEIKNSFRAGSP